MDFVLLAHKIFVLRANTYWGHSHRNMPVDLGFSFRMRLSSSMTFLTWRNLSWLVVWLGLRNRLISLQTMLPSCFWHDLFHQIGCGVTLRLWLPCFIWIVLCSCLGWFSQQWAFFDVSNFLPHLLGLICCILSFSDQKKIDKKKNIKSFFGRKISMFYDNNKLICMIYSPWKA